ncbi:MAG: tetratricopeptide repeat protein, partial [Chitinophagaceae bacterium]
MITDPDIIKLNIAISWQNTRTGNVAESLEYALKAHAGKGAQSASDFTNTRNIIAGLYQELGDPDKALAYQKEEFERAKSNFDSDPENPYHWVDLCLAYMDLGIVYFQSSLIEDSVDCFSNMYMLVSDHLVILPESIELKVLKALACEQLGNIFLRQYLPQNAYDYCVEYYNLINDLVRQCPDDADIKDKFIVSNIFVGYYYYLTNEITTALNYYSAANKAAIELTSTFNDNSQ